MAQWSFGQRTPSREAESTGKTLELLNKLSSDYGRMKVAVAQEEKKAAEAAARRRIVDAFKASSFRQVPVVEKDATGKERNVTKVQPVEHQEFLANYFTTRAQLSQLGAAAGELEGLDVAAKEWYQKETPEKPLNLEQLTYAAYLQSGKTPEEAARLTWGEKATLKATAPPTASASTVQTAEGPKGLVIQKPGTPGSQATAEIVDIPGGPPPRGSSGGKGSQGENIKVKAFAIGAQPKITSYPTLKEAYGVAKGEKDTALGSLSEFSDVKVSLEKAAEKFDGRDAIVKAGGIINEDEGYVKFSANLDALTSADEKVANDEAARLLKLADLALSEAGTQSDFGKELEKYAVEYRRAKDKIPAVRSAWIEYQRLDRMRRERWSAGSEETQATEEPVFGDNTPALPAETEPTSAPPPAQPQGQTFTIRPGLTEAYLKSKRPDLYKYYVEMSDEKTAPERKDQLLRILIDKKVFVPSK